ncbi:hypothetical protein HDU84_000887 [Entophlyctis sp. JEL0112]|nr:hypothetical protein HDU84_000887 [Entophlyctis sp. JEL0112]
MDSDNNIAAFCAVTGADADAARVYLALADASLDAAIALFLDNPLLAASATTTSSNRNNNNDHNRPLLSANNVAGVDDDDVYVDADDDDDVEFVSSTNQQQELQQDFVRAAIKPKHDTLVGNDFSYFDEHSLAQRPLGVRGRAAPRATQEKSGFDGAFALASSQTGASSSNPRANKLAKLFATPYDIMFNGGFDTVSIYELCICCIELNLEQAREVARELSKWILVTVSDRTEFACETQKRDLWNVGDVKEIISANFVFLFFPSESDDAKHHMSFYKVSGFPYIAIIDPRTGESMKTWYNSPKKEEFLSDLALFLDSYSLENFRAVNKRKAESSVGDLTEEEQLNLAIAASLNASAKSELDVKMAEASSPGCEIVDGKCLFLCADANFQEQNGR